MSEELIIPKEAISMSHFLKEEVHSDPSDIRQRN
jgi:hypothetical protein